MKEKILKFKQLLFRDCFSNEWIHLLWRKNKLQWCLPISKLRYHPLQASRLQGELNYTSVFALSEQTEIIPKHRGAGMSSIMNCAFQAHQSLPLVWFHPSRTTGSAWWIVGNACRDPGGSQPWIPGGVGKGAALVPLFALTTVCVTRESHSLVHCFRMRILKRSVTANKLKVKSTLTPTYGLLKEFAGLQLFQ